MMAWLNPKVRQSVEGRKEVMEQLRAFRSVHQGKVFWLHAASLGEFEQGRPVIERWCEYCPEYAIVVTFFSPSGYEIRKNYPKAALITYLPLDTPHEACSFLDVLKPDIAIFVKYDFWYNFLQEATQRKIIVVFISTIFRPDQIYFHRGSRLFLPLFRNINHFFVQNEQSKSLLEQNGVSAVTIAGDTRLDQVLSIQDTPFSNPIIEAFCGQSPTIIFGSTWYSDITFLQPIIPALREQFKLIFAPHHIDQRSLDQIMDLDTENTRLLSDGSVGNSVHTMIIDEIGSLSKIYRYAKYVYVGGALHEGLHNIMEPAVYGKPVFFARHPGNAKFQEALALEVSGGALSLEVSGIMLERIKELESDESAYKAAGEKASKYVNEQAGATNLIFDYLKTYA